MTNRLMISVAAAALIAGSGLAFAQGVLAVRPAVAAVLPPPSNPPSAAVALRRLRRTAIPARRRA